MIKKLSSSETLESPDYSEINEAAREVVSAYQNANKWLDSIKEIILIDLGCPFFSNFVHELAHSMPKRFDKFGDILHERHMKVSYPATSEIQNCPDSMDGCFNQIFQILDDIGRALRRFISSTKDGTLSFMATEAENLLVEINNEYISLGVISKMWDVEGTVSSFDRWVRDYCADRDKLL